MTVLSLVYAPDPIFKTPAHAVTEFDENLKALVNDMYDTLYHNEGLGIAANMVGHLQKIAVIDLVPDGNKQPLTLINPEIIKKSSETQTIEEASLCFPGISAQIDRPKQITIKYNDIEGNEQILEASDYLATVIQHELDYLEGRTYLDHLSKMKKERLIKKMFKYQKQHHHAGGHVHTAECNH